MSKIKTVDEYVLDELERAKNKVIELENKIKDIQPIYKEVEIAENTMKCYSIHAITHYNYDGITNKALIKYDFLSECLTDDKKLEVFIENASRGSSYERINQVYENNFNYEIKHLNVRVGIDIYKHFNDSNYNVRTYIIDDKQYFAEYDKAKEKLYEDVRSNIEDYLKKKEQKVAKELKEGV